jgi:C-terminal processing protease CtpA/Prc
MADARRSSGRWAVTAAALLLGACSSGGDGGGGGGSGVGACSETARKDFVLRTTREWYLFPELLPASVDPAAFATAEDLLDHLTATARAQGKDRFFSYLTTRSADSSTLGEGQFVGFGFRNREEPGPVVRVLDVYEGSPSADAGMRRGDSIVAIDSGSGFVAIETLLAGDATLSDALGPAAAGVRRGLRLENGGAIREISLVKRTVTIDPVPDGFGSSVLPLAGTTGVGYLNLRTYVSTADAQLRDAFAQFRARNLDYYVIDLRYNGGGLVATAELLGDLLGGARSGGDVFQRYVYSPANSSRNSTRTFRSVAQSVRPVRIAFLTTDASASASEINVNGMAPWVEVAIVGDDTFGKPVGQSAFDLAGCEDRLRLVTFANQNSRGQGDYYDGLAATLPFACAADDDVGTPLGATTDPMVAGALHWLQAGACSRTLDPAAVALRQKMAGSADRASPSRRPANAVEAWLPGVH